MKNRTEIRDLLISLMTKFGSYQQCLGAAGMTFVKYRFVNRFSFRPRHIVTLLMDMIALYHMTMNNARRSMAYVTLCK